MLQFWCPCKQGMVPFLPCTTKLSGGLVIPYPLLWNFIATRTTNWRRRTLGNIKQCWCLPTQHTWMLTCLLLNHFYVVAFCIIIISRVWQMASHSTPTNASRLVTLFHIYCPTPFFKRPFTIIEQLSIRNPRFLQKVSLATLPWYQLLEFSHLVKEWFSKTCLVPAKICRPEASLIYRWALEKVFLCLWGGKVGSP